MTRNSNKKKGMDLGRVLLWSAVLVESPRWAGAMLAADMSEVAPGLSAALNFANALAGFAMGIVVVVATAYLLDALRETKPSIAVRRNNQTVDRPNVRFYGLLVFVVGLLMLTPFVLGPFIVSRMTGETIATVLATPLWQFIWAIAVVVAPAFVIGGVAFAQPGLVTISTPGLSPGTQQSSRSVSGESPGMDANRRSASGALPETGEPMFRSFREVPEEMYTWIASAETAAIVKRFGLNGKDPERTARDWRKRVLARKEPGGEG